MVEEHPSIHQLLQDKLRNNIITYANVMTRSRHYIKQLIYHISKNNYDTVALEQNCSSKEGVMNLCSIYNQNHYMNVVPVNDRKDLRQAS